MTFTKIHFKYTTMKLTYEKLVHRLADAFFGKAKSERPDINLSVTITCYTVEQVDKVVEIYGGWENLASDIGKGTHFTVMGADNQDPLFFYVQEGLKPYEHLFGVKNTLSMVDKLVKDESKEDSV